MPDLPTLTPYDGLLYLSFGGPEGQDDVMPFLRNVTRGRGIPDERLAEVATHYTARGGKSPINDENRAVLARLRAELDSRGLATSVVWGNKNFEPYTAQALQEAHEAGMRRLLAVVTSAYSSYSGCRSYREDIARALAQTGLDLQIDVLRPYGHAEGFRAPMRSLTLEALHDLTEAGVAPQDVRILFVTHSIPTAMNESSGPVDQPGVYVTSHLALCEDVSAAVDADAGVDVPWQLTYCSRSGPPSQPWLEPDVGDAIAQLVGTGARGVLIVPIGFVSDHMEVVYDLDEEAVDVARKNGLAVRRVSTLRDDPQFVSGLVDLLLERARVEREAPQTPGVRCPVGCCVGPGPLRPTVSEDCAAGA